MTIHPSAHPFGVLLVVLAAACTSSSGGGATPDPGATADGGQLDTAGREDAQREASSNETSKDADGHSDAERDANDDQDSSPATTWVQTLNPSAGDDHTVSLQVDDTGVYVLGVYQTSDAPPAWVSVLQKRTRRDGTLVPEFGVRGVLTVVDAKKIEQFAIDSTGIYLAGHLPNGSRLIRKISKVDGRSIFSVTPPDSSGVVHAMAVDTSGLYLVGGRDCNQFVRCWLIEKRDLSTGAAISSFADAGVVTDTVADTQTISALDVAVDDAGLYVVGYKHGANIRNLLWTMDVRDPMTGAQKWASAHPEVDATIAKASGVGVDGSGMYVVGSENDQWSVEKRNRADGMLVKAFGAMGVETVHYQPLPAWPSGVAVDGSDLYVLGLGRTRETPSAPINAVWQLEKRSAVTGALVGSFGTGGLMQLNSSLPSPDYDYDPFLEALDMAVDDCCIYVVGKETKSSDGEWRIEKRSKLTGQL